MHPRVAALRTALSLDPHPEGGYFREVFRSTRAVSREGAGPPRSALTAIYFLLTAGQHSRWHRVASDEQWTFLEGDPLELFVVGPDSRVQVTRLGPSETGAEPVRVVPAGTWQAARPSGTYGLVTCTVGPGFDFADFEFLADHADAHARLTPALGALAALL